ncbi:MAG: hypothetical protein K5Q68_03760 [Roseococcus sp.]|nr:hypothetical protein [Roseococcus sp.]
MRSFLGGFLGLCLGLALLPDAASARTDARSSAQNASSSRAVTASRPAATRPAATRPAASRSSASTTRQAAASRTTRPTAANRNMARSGGTTRHAAAIPYARQPAAQAPRGLRQTAMASCTTRNGRRVCSPGATRNVAMRWTGGLAPAAMSQAGCPDGTIATMALGHNDITRCVPL